MAVDKLVDSAQLDSDLGDIAIAIRTKGGTSAQLTFPSGFISAIEAITTGITPTGTINITQSGNTDVTNYATANVASGSASTPATSITANPTISVSASGLITASVSGSQSVTPSVSAGYVSSGTAGTVSVSGSNTQQLTTQSAQTITPTTTNQTIASGKYLTGVQTILGDANLIAENIKKDISLFNIIGTYEGSGGGGQDDMDIVVKCNGNTFTNNASDYTFEVGSFVELLNKVMNGDKVCGIAYCREDYYDDEEDYTRRANWSILYLQNASITDYGGWWDGGTITFANIQPSVGAADRLVLNARSLTITGNDDPEQTKSFTFSSLQKTIS